MKFHYHEGRFTNIFAELDSCEKRIQDLKGKKSLLYKNSIHK